MERHHEPDIKKYIMSKIVITEAGCWEWQGAVKENGYCQTKRKGVKKYCHRMSYEAFVGPIPNGALVCHRCDNRRCVNPKHLFLGNATDNMHDMISKGRGGWLRGSDLSTTTLTESQVAEIFVDMMAGLSREALAKKWDVDASCLTRMRDGVTWGHVPKPENWDPSRVFQRARGSKHGRANITEEQVREIKEWIRLGAGTTDLAKFYGVTRNTVNHIKGGRCWGWVTCAS